MLWPSQSCDLPGLQWAHSLHTGGSCAMTLPLSDTAPDANGSPTASGKRIWLHGSLVASDAGVCAGGSLACWCSSFRGDQLSRYTRGTGCRYWVVARLVTGCVRAHSCVRETCARRLPAAWGVTVCRSSLPFARECRLGVWFGFVGAALFPAVGTCVVLAFGAMPGR